MQPLLLPPGRLVAGDLYTPKTTDSKGNPLVVKKPGPTQGQPRVDYFFGLAITKGVEQHWSETAWGQIIFGEASSSFPGGEAQRPDFAWKIVDGDSPVPNKNNKRPCDQVGYPGHWVLFLSQGFEPKLHTLIGSPDGKPRQLLEANAINKGDYVEVYGSVNANGDTGNPGVFINHSMVCLVGYGERISSGPDAGAVGFGGAPVPQGASAVPLAGGFNPASPGMPQQAGAPVAAQQPIPQQGAPVSGTVPAQQPAPLAAAPGQLPPPQQQFALPVVPLQQQPAPGALPANAAPVAQPTGVVPGAPAAGPAAGNYMTGQQPPQQ